MAKDDPIKNIERKFDEIYSNGKEISSDDPYKRWWVMGYLRGQLDAHETQKAWSDGIKG